MNEPIDSRQLRAFSILARTGSFTLVARELFLSQSAVSHSMKALEEDLGCRLLDRMGKKVFLTQAGEHFLRHATRILNEMDAARSALQHLGKWGQSRLRIAASTTACQHILPGVLRDFKQDFPNATVTIEPGDTPESIEHLHQRRVDLALVLEPVREDSLQFVPIFSDEMIFIVAPDHPWAAQGRAIRAEIPLQNFIFYNKASYTFRLVDRFFREEQLVLNSVMELGSMEAIKELVKLGLGVSVLAPWIARREIDERTLIPLPLGRRKLKRDWGILHARERRLNLPENRFIALSRTAGERLMLVPARPG
jgi:LysR family transcriptional regulator, low CO2-responsive transcriptional regulator